jgi:hypothetical protein
MSVTDLVVALVAAGLAAYSVTTVRAAWRDPDWRPLLRGWRFSPHAIVAQALIMVSVALLMIAVTVASATAGATARAITFIGAVPGMLGVLAGGLLAVTLTTAGRPESLVPPPFRAGRQPSSAQTRESRSSGTGSPGGPGGSQ